MCNIMADNQQEIFPIVDEEGTVVGRATRGECHSGSRLLHPVVHLHVFNVRGDVYLQKRPEWKDIQPASFENRKRPQVSLELVFTRQSHLKNQFKHRFRLPRSERT